MDDSKVAQLTRYIMRGWALVPLHNVVTALDGSVSCTCAGTRASCRDDKTGEYRSAGKHPRRARWQEGGNLVRGVATLATLHRAHPDWNWGVATGPVSGIWVLDVDDIETWMHLMHVHREHGPLPETWLQRTGGGGLQYAFKLPPDFVPNNSAGRLPPGIDVRGARRGEESGGQIVVAPSVSGKGAYQVLSDFEPIDASAWLLELIRPAPPRQREAGPPAGYSTTAREGPDALARYATTAITGECDALTTLATGRNNRAYAAACRVIELCNAAWSGVSLEDGYELWSSAVYAHPLGLEVPAREVDNVWRSALRQVGDREADPPPALPPMTGGDHIPLPPGLMAPAGPTGAALSPHQPSGVQEGTTAALCLPEAFWAARPVLQHIRQAAHARMVSGDVVFYGTLARLAALWPHQVRFSTGVKNEAAPNLFVAVVGPAGSGKTSGVGAARRMLDRPPWLNPEEFADDLPLGTGEGIAEAYMGQVARPVTDEHGVAVQNKDGSVKLEKVRAQTRHNALLYADEGEVIARLLERTGATIGETLRRAWAGQTLGQANGRAETTRIVREGSYSLGLVVGFQPTTCQPLLADVDAGTPQRFLWAWSIDPSLPEHDVEHPGALTGVWQAPAAGVELPGTGWLVQDGGGASDVDTRTVVFPATVTAYFRGLERDRMQGRYTPAPHDAHTPFTRAKVAVLLAALDGGRREVSEEDWALAGMVVDTSAVVRDYCLTQGALAQGKDRAAKIAAYAAQEGAAEDARLRIRDDHESRTLEQLALWYARKVAVAVGPVTVASVRKQAKSSWRPNVELAASLALERGWVTLQEDGRHVGGPVHL